MLKQVDDLMEFVTASLIPYKTFIPTFWQYDQLATTSLPANVTKVSYSMHAANYPRCHFNNCY